MSYKKILLRLGLIVQAGWCTWYCVYNPYQTDATKPLTELHVIHHEITALHNEIDHLAALVTDWNNEPFFQEKRAREELCMARPDEEIYIYS